MVSRWRADYGHTVNADLVTLLFSGDPDKYCLGPLSTLWIRAWAMHAIPKICLNMKMSDY